MRLKKKAGPFKIQKETKQNKKTRMKFNVHPEMMVNYKGF